MTRTRKALGMVALAAIVLALGFGIGRGVRSVRSGGGGGGAKATTGTIERAVRPLPTLPPGARPDEASGTNAPSASPVTGPGAAPAPVFVPRPAGEWQGMLVNTALQATCDTSSRCGLAMACHEDGVCGACTADSDCAGGEVCALDHCVRQAQAACRHASDCGGGALCVLSGYSTDARGNGAMTASCLAAGGGVAAPTPEQVARPETRPAAPAAVDTQAMMASLREAQP
jgi:hypothetical protein